MFGLLLLCVLLGAIVFGILQSGPGGPPSSIVQGTTLGRMATTDDLFLIMQKSKSRDGQFKNFAHDLAKIAKLFIALIVAYFLLSIFSYVTALIYFRIPIIGHLLIGLSGLGIIIFFIGFLALTVSRKFRAEQLRTQIEELGASTGLDLSGPKVSVLRTIGPRSYMGLYLTSFTSFALIGTLQLLTLAIFARYDALFQFVGWTNSVFIDTITLGILPPFGPFQPEAASLPFVGSSEGLSETNFQIYTVIYKFLLVAFSIPAFLARNRNNLNGEFRYRGNIFGLASQMVRSLSGENFDDQLTVIRVRNAHEVTKLTREDIIRELDETARGLLADLEHQDFRQITQEVTKTLSPETRLSRRFIAA